MRETPKINISPYCDYNETFNAYDRLRRPNGVAQVLARFGQTDIPLENQVILEGGFGTGAYIDAVRHHVKAIHGVEGSIEGFAQARQKMEAAANVYLQLGNILRLAFADETFDGYMVNQVLHHLDSEPGFPNLNVFFEESLRVLKAGGVLTINTSSQEQLDPHSGVFWNYRYIPQAVYAIRARHVPIEELKSRLEKFRFVDIQTCLPSQQIFHERYYTDPTFALDPDFQKGDSVHCFSSPREMQAALEQLRAEIADGSVYEEMARAARRKAEIGEGIIVSARKRR